MVSTSTRRFPSTAIDAAVWAAAGDDTSARRQRGGTGTANMIRAASKTPPHSHSKHSCATRPYHSDAGPYPYEPADSHLLHCL